MRLTDGPFPVWEIIPGALYQRGKLHSLALEPKLAGLERYGVTRVIALAPPTPDPDLRAWTGRFTNFPIPDGLLKKQEPLLALARELAEEIEADGCVLTMCNAGRNRSGLLSALVVRELSGIPGSAAMDVVRLHRPRAIANVNFEAFLCSLP